MRKVIFILLGMSILSVVSAQKGKEFWFAAPNVNDAHADEPLSLNISTYDESAQVTIYIPANPAFTPITRTIAPNSFEVIVLECHSDNRANPPHYHCDTDPVHFKTMLETEANYTVQNKGLLITSTADITVYYQVLGSNCNAARCKIANGDIFALKGYNALGTDFYVPWQNGHPIVTTDFWNDNLGGKQATSLSVVATKSNTTVTFTPTTTLTSGHAASTPFFVVLDSGQTYGIQSAGFAPNQHLNGTHIVSDKPIAVTVIDDTPSDRSDYAANGGKPQVYDLAGDQLIPVSKAGEQYIVSKFYAYVTATEASTTVTIHTNSGVTSVVLGVGQTHEVNMTSVAGPTFIEADKPVLLFHLRGIAGLNGYPEFGGAVVPQINCTGSRTVRFSRATNEFGEQFFITILVRASGINDFTLNGSSTEITGSDFQPVPGAPDWMYMDKLFNATQVPPFETSTVTNSSAVFHLGIVYGRPHIDKIAPLDSVSTGCQYGYFSNFGSIEVNIPDVSEQCLLPGEQIVLDPGIFDNYAWYRDESVISTDQTITITQNGTYALKISDVTGCSDSTSFNVLLGEAPEFNLGPDTLLCKDETVMLYIKDGSAGDNSTYNWNYIAPDAVGGVLVSTDTSIIADAPGTYVLTVNSLNCGQLSDSVYVDKWNVFVPNLITPNEDGKNDLFYVPGAQHGIWNLLVVNRWGQAVYKNENYQSDWNGRENEDGIYYFELSEESSKRCNQYKGWLHIMR